MLVILALLLAAMSGGCFCTCLSGEVQFETACRDRGGRVQTRASSTVCVADAGVVVATWVVEDSDAGGL